MRCVSPRLFGVVRRSTPAAARRSSSVTFPHYTRRSADDQAAGLEPFALGHQSASADDTLALDHRAVQNPCAHADQAIVGDGAAVEDCLVADVTRAPMVSGKSASLWPTDPS